MAVIYDGAAVQQYTYHAGVLRWTEQVQNQPVNPTDARLKFTEAPNGEQAAWRFGAAGGAGRGAGCVRTPDAEAGRRPFHAPVS